MVVFLRAVLIAAVAVNVVHTATEEEVGRGGGGEDEGLRSGELNAIRKQKCFLCSPFYGRACRWAMPGEIKI